MKPTLVNVSCIVIYFCILFLKRITGDIRELLESRTSKISEVKPVKLLDPLKVLVTIDDKQWEVVAVVDEGKDGRFTLKRVYYAQPQGKLTCDIVFPNKLVGCYNTVNSNVIFMMSLLIFY